MIFVVNKFKVIVLGFADLVESRFAFGMFSIDYLKAFSVKKCFYRFGKVHFVFLYILSVVFD